MKVPAKQLQLGGIPTPTTADKDLAALATANDGDPASSSTISSAPSGYVSVFVNGWKYSLGNGVKTKACFFSGDGGTTARAISAIVAGDTLYWNGSIAGVQLQTTDTIDFDYLA